MHKFDDRILIFRSDHRTLIDPPTKAQVSIRYVARLDASAGATLRGRHGDGQQVVDRISAEASESQIAMQRACQNARAGRIPALKLAHRDQ